MGRREETARGKISLLGRGKGLGAAAWLPANKAATRVASEYRFCKYSNIGHSFSFIFEYLNIFEYSNIFEYRQYPTISTK